MERVNIPIYNITLCMSEDIGSIVDEIKSDVDDIEDMYIPPTTTGYTARVVGDGEVVIYIYANSIPTAAHESFHSAREVFIQINDDPFATDNSEPFTYLLEWIMRQYMGFRGWPQHLA